MHSPAQKQSFLTRFCYEISVLDDLNIPLPISNLCIIQPQTRHYNKDTTWSSILTAKSSNTVKAPLTIWWWKFRALKLGGKSENISSDIYCSLLKVALRWKKFFKTLNKKIPLFIAKISFDDWNFPSECRTSCLFNYIFYSGCFFNLSNFFEF